MRCFILAEALVAYAIALAIFARYSESKETAGRPLSSIIIESPADFEVVESDFKLILKV